MNWKWCRVVNWVDKGYEGIGYPVCNPESLREGGFDSVLVAVESKETFRGIFSYLCGLGIGEKQIVWLFRNV